MGDRLKKERVDRMRSPLNFSVLGLVIERSSYGYELWKRFERIYGDWRVGGSAIYAALDALRRHGYIEEVEGSAKPVPGTSRQPKTTYRATSAGIDAYQAWVIEQAREHSRRSRQFARQLGALAEEPETALAILDRHEQACLDEMDARISTASEPSTGVAPGLGDRLAYAYGRGIHTATLGWVGYARHELETLQKVRSDEPA